jgi:hypothetical protein
MTEQQTILLIEANELAASLLKELLKASAIAEELKCSFDNWIEIQTEVNRISRILTKATDRCKRRGLVSQ